MATVETRMNKSRSRELVRQEQASLIAGPAPGRATKLCLAAGVLTALLLYLSFFPLNWGWLGWIALVPLLFLVAKPDPKRVYLAAWLCGLLFWFPALQWVRIASLPMYGAWVMMALILSLHFPIFVWFVRKLTFGARLPLLLAVPAAWIALEYLRAHLWVGFAWYYLGHTQHDYLAVIQIADLFGGYGVSFLVVMVNVLVFELGRAVLVRRGVVAANGQKLPGALQLMGSSVVVVLLLAATLVYGAWRLNQTDFETGPRLALLQGNLPQDIRNDPEKEIDIFKHFAALADQGSRQQPDLIVWSETSYPSFWLRVSPELDLENLSADQRRWAKEHRHSDELAEAVAKRWQAPSLIGFNAATLEPDGVKKYNTAVLIGADGRVVDHYDKMYRVPFGEYVPHEKSLPFMRWFTPYDSDYSIEAGESFTVFEQSPRAANTRPYRFAVLICYEDTVPHLAPAFMRQPSGGAAPDFFLNISNDGWFKGWEEHEQHMVGARFRAVECRRAVARSVNMGISGIIDGNGRVVAMPGATWSKSKAREAVVVAAVPLDRRQSYYVQWGDVLPWLCWALIGVGLAVAGWRWWAGKSSPPYEGGDTGGVVLRTQDPPPVPPS